MPAAFRSVAAWSRVPARAFGFRGHAAVFLAYALFLAAASRLPAHDAAERFALAEAASLAAGLFLSVVVLALAAAFSFSAEFEDRAGYVVFSKPAGRGAAFLGKALGLLEVLFVWNLGFAAIGFAVLLSLKASAGDDLDRPVGEARRIVYPERLEVWSTGDETLLAVLPSRRNGLVWEGIGAGPWVMTLRRLEEAHRRHGAEPEGGEGDDTWTVRGVWWPGRTPAAFALAAKRPGPAAPGEFREWVSAPLAAPAGTASLVLEGSEEIGAVQVSRRSLASPLGRPAPDRLKLLLFGDEFTWLPDVRRGIDASWSWGSEAPSSAHLEARFRFGAPALRGNLACTVVGHGMSVGSAPPPFRGYSRSFVAWDGRVVRLAEMRRASDYPEPPGAEAPVARVQLRLLDPGAALQVSRKTVYGALPGGPYWLNYLRAWGMGFSHAGVLVLACLAFAAISKPRMAALLSVLPLVADLVTGFLEAAEGAGAHAHGPPDLLDRLADLVLGAIRPLLAARISLDPSRFLAESLRIPDGVLAASLMALAAGAAALGLLGSLALRLRRLD